MKAKPILFNGAMVQSIFANHKTATRRPITSPEQWTIEDQGGDKITYAAPDGDHYNILDVCPFGKASDLLYVRETFGLVDCDDGFNVVYAASAKDFKKTSLVAGGWTPSIHMPRCNSRLTLVIAGVKVERLQDISDDDCLAEGVLEDTGVVDVRCYGGAPVEIKGWVYTGTTGEEYSTPQEAFEEIWDAAYADTPFAWHKNPYVWAVDFKVVKQNVDDYIAGLDELDKTPIIRNPLPDKK